MQDWKKLEKQLLSDKAVMAEGEKLAVEHEIARQIISFRLSKKMTQAELAERAGLKQAYIARLESGTINPTLETLNKVAKVLDKRLKLVGV